jgi:hypothetical protein
MRPIYILFLVFLANILHAQIEHTVYVNDVEYVENLTLNFCVDSLGKTVKVKVDPETTTYSNQEIIDQIIEYRKSIQYSPNPTLTNNCNKHDFELVNVRLKEKHLDENECSLTPSFKSGKFKYLNAPYRNVEIERNENFQIERIGDYFLKFSIIWISPCKYDLTYVEVSDDEEKRYLGTTIHVEIIEVINSFKYIYRTNYENRIEVNGVMEKIH